MGTQSSVFRVPFTACLYVSISLSILTSTPRLQVIHARQSTSAASRPRPSSSHRSPHFSHTQHDTLPPPVKQTSHQPHPSKNKLRSSLPREAQSVQCDSRTQRHPGRASRRPLVVGSRIPVGSAREASQLRQLDQVSARGGGWTLTSWVLAVDIYKVERVVWKD